MIVDLRASRRRTFIEAPPRGFPLTFADCTHGGGSRQTVCPLERALSGERASARYEYGRGSQPSDARMPQPARMSSQTIRALGFAVLATSSLERK